MSKKSKQSSDQGTYALCITVGFVVGVGLGPAMGSVLIMAIVGVGAGALAGYAFTHRRKNRKRPHSH